MKKKELNRELEDLRSQYNKMGNLNLVLCILCGLFFLLIVLLIIDNLANRKDVVEPEKVIEDKGIVEIRRGTYAPPTKAFGKSFEVRLVYHVYKDAETGVCTLRLDGGLLIDLLTADGSPKQYSEIDENYFTIVSESDDFFILKDMDTGVQYVVSVDHESYYVRRDADGDIYIREENEK